MEENRKNASPKEDAQKLRDFDVLKDLINGNIEVDSIDNDTKVRLISMCCDRSKQIEKKIETLKNNDSNK
ncbi:MAG: hypothetical protein IKE01_06790 [Clostridia bacterium]|nr:hypothetical protein [Clostridia bacterium]